MGVLYELLKNMTEFSDQYCSSSTVYRPHRKEKKKGHHGNVKDTVCRMIGCLTIGFNGKNYIFPYREFKIHDSHLKHGKYVQWD